MLLGRNTSSHSDERTEFVAGLGVQIRSGQTKATVNQNSWPDPDMLGGDIFRQKNWNNLREERKNVVGYLTTRLAKRGFVHGSVSRPIADTRATTSCVRYI